MNLTTTQYRVDARPFPTEAAATAAINHYLKDCPEDRCSVRNYTGEGFYVYLQFPAGGARWLTMKG